MMMANTQTHTSTYGYVVGGRVGVADEGWQLGRILLLVNFTSRLSFTTMHVRTLYFTTRRFNFYFPPVTVLLLCTYPLFYYPKFQLLLPAGHQNPLPIIGHFLTTKTLETTPVT